MTYLVVPSKLPAHASEGETHAAREARLIAVRLASARKWARRQRWLALRATVFGRRKERLRSQRKSGRMICARAIT